MIKSTQAKPKHLLQYAIMGSAYSEYILEQFMGGWNETINCLKNLDEINYKQLIAYFKKFNNKTIARKTGYILEKLNNLNPSQKIIEEIKELSGSNDLYFDTTKKGIYDQKWNLIIPKNIIEAINAH